mgnify:CR=1 FL=1
MCNFYGWGTIINNFIKYNAAVQPINKMPSTTSLIAVRLIVLLSFLVNMLNYSLLIIIILLLFLRTLFRCQSSLI